MKRILKLMESLREEFEATSIEYDISEILDAFETLDELVQEKAADLEQDE